MPYLTSNVGREEWAAYVLDGLARETALLAAGARRIVTGAKSIHVPVPGAAATQWLAELEEINQDAAVAAEVELTPQKVGNLSIASNEAIGDASVDLLSTIGATAVRAVALEIDRALIAGSGTANQPRGLLNITGVPSNATLNVDYAGLVTAAGTVRGAGGRPDVAFISPADHTALALAADGLNRPLLQATDQGPAEVVGGLRLWPTPAVPAGTAIVGQADQILVAVRDDPRVDISTDARFGADAVAIRTIARVDVGIANLSALLVIR